MDRGRRRCLNWLGSQATDWDTLAGLPGLGEPVGPQILKTPVGDPGLQILKTPVGDPGPQIWVTPVAEHLAKRWPRKPAAPRR